MWASVNFAATAKLEKMREQSLFLTSTINCELILDLVKCTIKLRFVIITYKLLYTIYTYPIFELKSWF